MKYKLLAALLLFISIPSIQVMAQPELPDVGAVTRNGINILSWRSPFKSGIQFINIQRSMDSTFNFQTIGHIKDLEKVNQRFIDTRPYPGKNWYRVEMVFKSGTVWTSNKVSLTLDSADIANRKPLPPNDDSLQAIISRMDTNIPLDQTVEKLNRIASYTKSRYVYTNPFTGNIDIEIPDANKNNYSLSFYDRSGKEILHIPRINDTDVILDKRNFQITGILSFKLLKNNEDFEKGEVALY